MSKILQDIKKNFQGLAVIVVFILGCLLLFFAGKMVYKVIFKKDIRIEYYQNRLSAEVKRINTVVESAQKTPQDLAYILEFHEANIDEMNILLESVLFNNEELYGSCIAFEPYRLEKDSLYNSCYAYRENDVVKYTNLNGEKYNYFYKDWYLIPKTLKKPVWSEPYYDEGGGNSLMSTYSVPFYKLNGNKETFNGIVTVDVSVDWLTDFVKSVGRTLSGYPILVSENGTIISAFNKELIFHETIFTLAEENNLPILRQIGRALQHGKRGYIAIDKPIKGKKWYAFYCPVPANKWGLIILVPESELYDD
jgi:Cache domain.